MDLLERVQHALEDSLHPDRITLEDDDGISGFVVSPRFRHMESIDRQTLIYDVLRTSSEQFDPGEIRRVIAIAALTPEEYIGHTVNH